MLYNWRQLIYGWNTNQVWSSSNNNKKSLGNKLWCNSEKQCLGLNINVVQRNLPKLRAIKDQGHFKKTFTTNRFLPLICFSKLFKPYSCQKVLHYCNIIKTVDVIYIWRRDGNKCYTNVDPNWFKFLQRVSIYKKKIKNKG